MLMNFKNATTFAISFDVLNIKENDAKGLERGKSENYLTHTHTHVAFNPDSIYENKYMPLPASGLGPSPIYPQSSQTMH